MAITLDGTNGITSPNVSTSEGPVYDRGNILGTVTEAAGVPTGAIIERGSNANGEFVKFADGTQICIKTITSVGPINIAYENIFRSDDFSSGAPAAVFSQAPFVNYTARGNGSLTSFTGSFLDATTTTLGSFMLTRALSSPSTGFNVDILAIGRWF